MRFSLLDLDAQQITKDKSKITLINNLLKDVVILKPGKRNGVVLLDINDYRTSVKHLFSVIVIQKIPLMLVTGLKTFQKNFLTQVIGLCCLM